MSIDSLADEYKSKRIAEEAFKKYYGLSYRCFIIRMAIAVGVALVGFVCMIFQYSNLKISIGMYVLSGIMIIAFVAWYFLKGKRQRKRQWQTGQRN